MMVQESNLLYFLETLGQCLSQDQTNSDHKPYKLGVHMQHTTNAVQEPKKAASRNMRTTTSLKRGVSHQFQASLSNLEPVGFQHQYGSTQLGSQKVFQGVS